MDKCNFLVAAPVRREFGPVSFYSCFFRFDFADFAELALTAQAMQRQVEAHAARPSTASAANIMGRKPSCSLRSFPRTAPQTQLLDDLG